MGKFRFLVFAWASKLRSVLLFANQEKLICKRQCIYSVFGGDVDVTGEILHGKTSPLSHDAKGIYANVPQNIPVTRYHSLAGTHPTLPDCLEVTSWISSGPDGGKGVIMGVRHKKYLIEGVQFHPESILTAEGRLMLRNFLEMRGGTWEENKRLTDKAVQSSYISATAAAVSSSTKEDQETNNKTSILETIYDHRRAAVSLQKSVPSQRPSDLQAAYQLGISPPQIAFPDRLRRSPYRLSLMAEIKRASPSKGVISLSTCAPAQARAYALAGASVISVLTEPEWFKGSIDDLRAVRQSLEGMPNRPAILRKEFIFDEYQILEARLAGADTVLLIVKMLEEKTLQRLYEYSKSLGMEPLVEVNTVEETKIAVSMGAKVIGVNNRNLVNFEVDLDTTSRLMENVPKDVIVCALSGIAGPKDVEPYEKNGVGAVLVGEALMRAPNTAKFVSDLLGRTNVNDANRERLKPLVKICGTRSAAAAKAAIEGGADLIGIILVEGKRRTVAKDAAMEISNTVHSIPKPNSIAKEQQSDSSTSDFFDHTSSKFLCNPQRALLVGVFQNQPLEYILQQQVALNLDVVQLHGGEPLEWARLIPVPVLKSFHPGDSGIVVRGYHSLPLLDSGTGGTGTQLDLSSIKDLLKSDSNLKIILAGGLDSSSLPSIYEQLGDLIHQIAAVDVCSGVEENGEQSIDKIKDFIASAK